jgi:hypothetical protein
LGNKFFQYLRAGLAILVSDNPEMASIVNDHECGWVYSGCEEDLSAFVDSLSINEVRERRRHAASTGNAYTWAREESSLHQLYESLFNIRIEAAKQVAA